MIEFITTDQILAFSEIARKGETNNVQTLGSILGTHSTRYSTEKTNITHFSGHVTTAYSTLFTSIGRGIKTKD